MAKIYTRTGDRGETGLIGGERVAKSHPRIIVLGDLDELNATLGAARSVGADADLDSLLGSLQDHLFRLGASLAIGPKRPKTNADVAENETAWVEKTIDRLEAELEPLRNFVLPGGSHQAAILHLARSVCRRAERELTILAGVESVKDTEAAYLNRLSDLLFVMARAANARAGVPEIKWTPGSNR